MFSGNTAFSKKVGMRLFTEGMSKLEAEFESNEVGSMRSALKLFPTNSMIYTLLVSIAQGSTGDRQKELANDILKAPGAPPGAKTLAEHLLKGTKPYEVGKPVDIQFTALDGRQVDLAKLKGKVVLVEFWSTSCGPCVARMPEVKAAYQKFQDRGFEVIGICLDDRESVLRRFIKEKELSWPQYFDGKGWENKFSLRYGIFAIPTMWLVDTAGNLCSTEAELGLERQVASLLDAKSAVGK
jgi:peroxiredoxin